MTVDQGACNDRAEPRQREGSVYGQPGPSEVALRRNVLDHGRDGGCQLRQSLSGVRGHRYDRRGLKRRAFQSVLYVGHDELDPLIVNEVLLGEGYQSARYPEQVENGEMLARLGHHRLVRGHHQQRDVYAADAGEHVVHEPLVSGYVHDAEPRRLTVAEARRSRGLSSDHAPSPRRDGPDLCR